MWYEPRCEESFGIKGGWYWIHNKRCPLKRAIHFSGCIPKSSYSLVCPLNKQTSTDLEVRLEKQFPKFRTLHLNTNLIFFRFVETTILFVPISTNYWSSLIENLLRHNCNFLLNSVLAQKSMRFNDSGRRIHLCSKNPPSLSACAILIYIIVYTLCLAFVCRNSLFIFLKWLICFHLRDLCFVESNIVWYVAISIMGPSSWDHSFVFFINYLFLRGCGGSQAVFVWVSMKKGNTPVWCQIRQLCSRQYSRWNRVSCTGTTEKVAVK